jgi:chromosome condensin MukBEF ATPase and DNA-binding subunit MukB
MRKTSSKSKILRATMLHSDNMLTAHGGSNYPHTMEQRQLADHLRSSGGGAMSKAANAKDRVDTALSRLESMVEERLTAETARSDELARRLGKLEKDHDELRKVAVEVEGRLERAMEYIRSLLAADQN